MRNRLALLAALLLLLATALAVPGCGDAGGPANENMHVATPTSPPASQTDAQATAQAKVTLRAFFAAWKAKDAEACATYLPAYRQGPAWEFEGLDRVEFGAIKASPEQIKGYLTNGSGSATGVAREDVACFQANATFFYKPGYQGPATEGEAMRWHWFLERDDAGTWVVTDWGY